MFVYTTLEESYAEHQRLLESEKAFLDKLELAYRVIDTAAGDLGLSAPRKFDCEAWIPTQGKYRELTSTSNCTDFQARRLDTRGRFDDGRRAGRHPERHALRDRPAPSSRSSRPTSRPTARSGCRRRSSRGSARRGPGAGRRHDLRRLAARGWSPSTSTARCSSGRGRRDDARGDLARLRDAVHRRSTPAPTSCSPAAARPHGVTPIADLLELHGQERDGSGSSPAMARWCSATHRSRSSTRRSSTPAGGRGRLDGARRARRGRGARGRLPRELTSSPTASSPAT